MELDFDKEIDALLRQSARGGDAAFASAKPQTADRSLHLDADEISAFAENALPEKTRQNYILHLADCGRCRKNLSSLIAFNNDAEIQTVDSRKREITASPIPWYRKLFAAPNLAYALGALVLIFSGAAVFTVLQNGGEAQNTQVSQITERQPNGKGMASDGDAPPPESYSNNAMSNASISSSTATTNSAASSSNFAMPAAPVVSANSNAATAPERDKDLPSDAKSPTARSQPSESAKTNDTAADGAALAPPKPLKEENYSAESEAQKQQPVQNQAAQNQAAQNQTNITPDSKSVQTMPKLARRAEDKSKKLQEPRSDAQDKAAETTSVGGKTFKRANNAWLDAAYRGQATTNVTRGTKEYKKLDSGLRAIAENLGGTVVVVWKEKAYRIQ